MIPPSFLPARLRGVFPVDTGSQEVGASFELAGGAVRMRIPISDARTLATNLQSFIDLHDRTRADMPDPIQKAG